MNIYGNSIVLRAITESDAQLLLEMINDPDTERMLGGSSFPVSMHSQLDWIKNKAENGTVLRCIIAERENEEVGLGTIILSDIDRKNGTAQVHIKMGVRGIRGKGYGSDALNAIASYAFQEMRLNCIYAEVLEYNTASRRLFEKCFFSKDGLLRSRVYKNGRFVNVIVYSRLKDDRYES